MKSGPSTKIGADLRTGAVLTVVLGAGCPFPFSPPIEGDGDDEVSPSDNTSAGPSSDQTGSSASEPPSDDTSPPVTTSTPAESTPTDTPSTSGAESGETTGGVEPTACELLGGLDPIAALVEHFTAIVYEDSRINVYFLNEGFVPAKFSTCMSSYLAAELACEGATYNCADLQAVHQGMGLSSADVADFHEDFVAAITAYATDAGKELPSTVTMALVDAVDQVGASIVEDAGGDASIYQRIGRNPALLGFAADLNARIAAHPALGSFWGGVADPDETSGCYSRFVGDADTIGGPMRYGKEILQLPLCQDIKDAVKGNDDPMISLNDFMSFMVEVADQVGISFAAASQADREALVQVFAEQCEAVVSPVNDCPSAHEVVEVTFDNPNGWFIPAYDPMEDPPVQMCRTFTVASTEHDYVGEVWIKDFALTHTWGGDLVITLSNPEQDILLHLLKRPGYPMLPTGYGPVFDKGWPVSFLDDGDINGQNLGKNYMPGDIVCKQYLDCEIYPPPNIMEPNMSFSEFIGVKASGDWTLCIEDHTIDGHTGYLYGATLHLDKVNHWP